MSLIQKISSLAQRNREKKAKEIGDNATNSLNEMLNVYFNDYEVNKDSFEKFNLEWKKHAQYINSIQKVVNVRLDSFEVETARIIKENPQFQTIVDITNL